MKNGSMRVVRPSGAIMRNGSLTAMLSALACSTGVVSAQPNGGGGGQLPPPVFEPEVVFFPPTGGAYGIDSADFLKQDENGNWVPGQDGFPEIAVAGAGVLIFDYCDDPTEDHSIRIMHNTGDWENLANGLVSGQTLHIPNGSQGSPDIRATELAFADVTGDNNGPDLVLLGYDSNTETGYLLVYKNDGMGSFTLHQPLFTVPGLSLRGLVVKDFDLDGDIDIVAAAGNCIKTGQPRDKLVVFRNLFYETDEFDFASPVLHSLGIANGTAPGDIVAGDFYPLAPGMPLLDLVTPNPTDSSVSKAANLGSLQFSTATEGIPSECLPDWGFVTATAGQFGADVHWDFAAVLPEDLFVGVFKGEGLGQFESYCDDPTLGYQLFPPDFEKLHAHGIDSGNLNGGPNLDLAVVIRRDVIEGGDPEWSGAVAVLLGRADGTFQTPSAQEAYIFPLYQAGAALIEVVDLNADGFDDIVVTNNEFDSISVLINSMSVNPG